ncbi:hypothetical protein ABK040_012119 [Willaertia magna]
MIVSLEDTMLKEKKKLPTVIYLSFSISMTLDNNINNNHHHVVNDEELVEEALEFNVNVMSAVVRVDQHLYHTHHHHQHAIPSSLSEQQQEEENKKKKQATLYHYSSQLEDITINTSEINLTKLDQLEKPSIVTNTSSDSTITVATTPTEQPTTTTTSKRPSKKVIINLILFLLGTMFFKFSFETLGNAIGLTILKRLDGHPLGATTILSILTILYGVAQSISSTFVEGLTKKIRPTRIYSIVLFYFAILIIILIIIEASTGGTLTKAGAWSPWILYPIHINIGLCVGVIEVVRKIIPSAIVGGENTLESSSTLKRLNAGIHICYELAGTVGAFLSSVFIQNLGSIYATCHMPVTFFISGILLFFVSLKNTNVVDNVVEENKIDNKDNNERKDTIITSATTVNTVANNDTITFNNNTVTNNNSSSELIDATENSFNHTNNTATSTSTIIENNNSIFIYRFKKALKWIWIQIKDYFMSLFIGAKITCCNRYYLWLIPCFVLPQVLHRIIENIFLPTFATKILHEGSYSGIMLGGSNFGELCGAGILLIFAKYVKKPTIWIIGDALFLNLMWIFPFLTFSEQHKDPTTGNPIGTPTNLIFSICIIPAMVLVSGSWAAGDITQLAYLQSTLSEESTNGINHLAAVMSFLYSCYVLLMTFIVFGLSQAVDRFTERGQTSFGFMTICIVLSVCSVSIVIIYLLFAKFRPINVNNNNDSNVEITAVTMIGSGEDGDVVGVGDDVKAIDEENPKIMTSVESLETLNEIELTTTRIDDDNNHIDNTASMVINEINNEVN